MEGVQFTIKNKSSWSNPAIFASALLHNNFSNFNFSDNDTF